MVEEWDQYYLSLAKFVAQRSKDPSTKCGAVIVRPDNTVASLGYNGFPKGMADTDERLNNRPDKYSRVIHCEMNALLNCHDQNVNGYTLYVWPFLCCDRCAAHVIGAGITRVVYPLDSEEREYHKLSEQYFWECGVEVNAQCLS